VEKKNSGSLDAHTSGFRYTVKGSNVDIIYANVKNWFLQRTSGSLSSSVIIHFHLHNPILIKGKKTKNIQFYTETGESSSNLGKAGRLTDREEEEAERRERELEGKINKQFKSFCVQVQKLGYLNYEEPMFDIGFSGVAHKDVVSLLPTDSCLINLIEFPFFVLCMEDVHIAFFERAQFILKQFDLVFVMKDFSQKEVHITCIPREHKESIKNWLNSSNIKFYETSLSLYWPNILLSLKQDPKKFWEKGGWKFYEQLEERDGESSEEHSNYEYLPPEELELKRALKPKIPISKIAVDDDKDNNHSSTKKSKKRKREKEDSKRKKKKRRKDKKEEKEKEKKKKRRKSSSKKKKSDKGKKSAKSKTLKDIIVDLKSDDIKNQEMIIDNLDTQKVMIIENPVTQNEKKEMLIEIDNQESVTDGAQDKKEMLIEIDNQKSVTDGAQKEDIQQDILVL